MQGVVFLGHRKLELREFARARESVTANVKAVVPAFPGQHFSVGSVRLTGRLCGRSDPRPSGATRAFSL